MLHRHSPDTKAKPQTTSKKQHLRSTTEETIADSIHFVSSASSLAKLRAFESQAFRREAFVDRGRHCAAVRFRVKQRETNLFEVVFARCKRFPKGLLIQIREWCFTSRLETNEQQCQSLCGIREPSNVQHSFRVNYSFKATCRRKPEGFTMAQIVCFPGRLQKLSTAISIA